MEMTKASLRHWIAGFEAAAEIDRRELLDHPASSQETLERLVSLVGFAVELHGWPLPQDSVAKRELAAACDSWDRLRARFAAR